MSRSVSVPYGAQVVAYDHVDTSEWDAFDAQYEWEGIEDYALERIIKISPSMSPADGWAGREDKILASNGHAQFGMSEYCGLVSYWLIPRENALAEAWVNKIARRFKYVFATITKVGSMSNGEGVFQSIKRENT